MKKSLQYVLIMSALGLQSGVLHAQETEAEVDPQLVGADQRAPRSDETITLGEFKDILGGAQNNPAWMSDSNLPTLDELVTTLQLKDNFSYEDFGALDIKQRIALANLFVNSKKGQKFILHGIPNNEKDKLMTEIATIGYLDNVTNLYQAQGFAFLAAARGKNIYEGGMSLMRPEITVRFNYIMNHPYPDEVVQVPTSVPMGMTSLTMLFGHSRIPAQDGFLDHLINDAVGIKGDIDMTNFLESPNFTNSDRVLFFANAGVSTFVVEKISRFPDGLKTKMIELVVKYRTNKDVTAQAGLDALMYQVIIIHPEAWRVDRGDWERIRRNAFELAKNPKVPFYFKAQVLLTMKNNIKDAKSQVEFDNMKSEVIKGAKNVNEKQLTEKLLEKGRFEDLDLIAGELIAKDKLTQGDDKNKESLSNIKEKKGSVERVTTDRSSKKDGPIEAKPTKAIDKKEVK